MGRLDAGAVAVIASACALVVGIAVPRECKCCAIERAERIAADQALYEFVIDYAGSQFASHEAAIQQLSQDFYGHSHGDQGE